MTDQTTRDNHAPQAQAIALDWLLRVKARPDDAQLRIELATWLASSEEHARAWRKAEKVWRLTGDALATPAPLPVSTMPTSLAPQRRHSTPRRRRRLAGAAALAGILLLAGLLPLHSSSDYQTAAGDNRQIELIDGSHIHLDSRTALDIDLQADRRAVTLHDGQAFFQVSADAQRPFSVSTAELLISVTGTAFEVRQTEAETRITVQQGSVRVSAPVLNTLADTALNPGDQLSYDRRSGHYSIDQRPIAQIASWRQGKLLVESEPLSEVIAELRRYHKGLIVLRSERLGSQQVTGAYNLANPESALRAAVTPHAGKVQRITPYLIVLSD